jgi:5-formyltetrahydrofolate cyclo-ligase
MDKQVVREIYKRIRLDMSASEVQTKSRLICKKILTDIALRKHERVCVYSPLAKLNEVDISPLSARLGRYGADAYMIDPSRVSEIPAEKFDLIIVPCLAFDSKNYRLGWGGGWYDKFLAGQPQAIKLGVCYINGFIKEGLPNEPHDIPMDMIITEG